MEMNSFESGGCIPTGLGGRIHADVSACALALAEPSKGVRLFGVKLTDYQNCSNDDHDMGMMRKSVSMGNLGILGLKSMHRHSDSVHGHPEEAALRLCLESGLRSIAANGETRQGYASDGLMQSSSMSSRERRKGVPWTEEEHRLFLAGLQKLGKGDWRGISRNFVTTRTPTQVASHAQKYFLRQSNLNKRKRRSSLFDIINSNVVSARNLTEEDPQSVSAEEFNQPIWELGMRQLTAPSSAIINPLSPSAQPRMMPFNPIVSADLCLGRSSCVKQQETSVSVDDVLFLHSHRGKQASVIDAFFRCNKVDGLDGATTSEFRKPVISISSSSSRSLSSSPSSSLCRIDEASELSSLSLSIAPPMATDQSSELALKLEPPMASRPSAIFPSTTKVCERKDVLLTAGA